MARRVALGAREHPPIVGQRGDTSHGAICGRLAENS